MSGPTTQTRPAADARESGGGLHSMTGFAAGTGEADGHAWDWELRGVNGRGLDLRLRLPDGAAALEQPLRMRLSSALHRGNVTLSLRLRAAESGGRMCLSPVVLEDVLAGLRQVEAQAARQGIALAPSRAADLLALRGVLDWSAVASAMDDALRAAMLADFDALLARFAAMRAAEGAELGRVIGAQLDRIAGLTEQAATAAEARRPAMRAALEAALARVMEGAPGADEGRVAQELAVLATKADVTEELDRLRSHAAAARALLAAGSPAGRKLDFLTQEFNREANTLCSKAQDADLTALGLELKSVIEQMREQVQNVE